MLSMPLGTGGRGAETFFLTIGLNNGVLLRAKLDPRNGQLSDTRTRFLGTKPAKLFRLPIGGVDGVLCLSSRPWAAYCWQQQLTLSPIAYQHLEHGCSFASEHCPEGLVAIAGSTPRILTLTLTLTLTLALTLTRTLTLALTLTPTLTLTLTRQHAAHPLAR